VRSSPPAPHTSPPSIAPMLIVLNYDLLKSRSHCVGQVLGALRKCAGVIGSVSNLRKLSDSSSYHGLAVRFGGGAFHSLSTFH
jgi:hypothetical protein